MRRIIFVHQGKTGGTSLVRALTGLLGKENTLHDVDQREKRLKPLSYRVLETILEPRRNYAERSRFAFIHGHFDPRKYKKAFPEALFITFYRDPLEQFVSLYHYWRRTPLNDHNPYRLALLKRDMDLTSFADMTLKPREMKRWASVYNINAFDFVGITEEYDASVHVLRTKYISGLPATVAPKNINPEKGINDRYTLDSDTHDYLSAKLSPKMQVYKCAREHFSKDLQEINSKANEHALYLKTERL